MIRLAVEELNQAQQFGQVNRPILARVVTVVRRAACVSGAWRIAIFGTGLAARCKSLFRSNVLGINVSPKQGDCTFEFYPKGSPKSFASAATRLATLRAASKSFAR